MPLLLNIDTATEYAGVCLSEHGQVLAKEEDKDQKNHASFLQEAIQQIFSATKRTMQEIDAVAVTGGPGSYTGVRVGLSSAKGICYALNKPLIMLNTLQVIAAAALEEIAQTNIFDGTVFQIVPMIDARRMEVFAGVYNQELYPLSETKAIILDESYYLGLNKDLPLVFCGNGSLKLNKESLGNRRMIIGTQHTVNHMITLSEKAFSSNHFANVAYAEPTYVKEFHHTQ